MQKIALQRDERNFCEKSSFLQDNFSSIQRKNKQLSINDCNIISFLFLFHENIIDNMRNCFAFYFHGFQIRYGEIRTENFS